MPMPEPPDSEIVVLAASKLLGLAVASSIGVNTTSVHDIHKSPTPQNDTIVVLVFDRESDLEAIGAIDDGPGVVARVVVYDERMRHLVARAVRASGGLALSMEDLDLINHVLILAERGHITVPCATFEEIRRREVPPLGMTRLETRWLAQLRDGATVATLARQAGYSERSMHRQLHKLYSRIGVAGRSEALRLLEEEG